jgi:hypothetical protein
LGQKLNTPKHQIKLRRGDGTWYEQTIEHFSGAVQDIGLVVLPGQTIYVEADVSGDRPTNFHEVDHIEEPGKTIIATFEQMDDGGMILNLAQPFKKDLKFDMVILRPGADHFAETSSLPVRAGGNLGEMWPYPISMMVLKNARLIDQSDVEIEACYRRLLKYPTQMRVNLLGQQIRKILLEEFDIARGAIKFNWWTVLALIVFINMVVKVVSKK